MAGGWGSAEREKTSKQHPHERKRPVVKVENMMPASLDQPLPKLQLLPLLLANEMLLLVLLDVIRRGGEGCLASSLTR
jgi:hypothetical protein